MMLERLGRLNEKSNALRVNGRVMSEHCLVDAHLGRNPNPHTESQSRIEQPQDLHVLLSCNATTSARLTKSPTLAAMAGKDKTAERIWSDFEVFNCVISVSERAQLYTCIRTSNLNNIRGSAAHEGILMKYPKINQSQSLYTASTPRRVRATKGNIFPSPFSLYDQSCMRCSSGVSTALADGASLLNKAPRVSPISL